MQKGEDKREEEEQEKKEGEEEKEEDTQTAPWSCVGWATAGAIN